MGNITNGQIPKNKDLKYCGANVSKKLAAYIFGFSWFRYPVVGRLQNLKRPNIWSKYRHPSTGYRCIDTHLEYLGFVLTLKKAFSANKFAKSCIARAFS